MEGTGKGVVTSAEKAIDNSDQTTKQVKLLSTSSQLLNLYYSHHFRFLVHSIVLIVMAILDLVGNDADQRNYQNLEIISSIMICLYFIQIVTVAFIQIGLFACIQKWFSDRAISLCKCLLCFGEISLQIEFLMQSDLNINIIVTLFRIAFIIITFVQWETSIRYRYLEMAITFIYLQVRSISYTMDSLTTRFNLLLLFLVYLQTASENLISAFILDSNSNQIFFSHDQDFLFFKDKMTISQQQNSGSPQQTRQNSRGITFGGNTLNVYSFANKKLTASSIVRDQAVSSNAQQPQIRVSNQTFCNTSQQFTPNKDKLQQYQLQQAEFQQKMQRQHLSSEPGYDTRYSEASQQPLLTHHQYQQSLGNGLPNFLNSKSQEITNRNQVEPVQTPMHIFSPQFCSMQNKLNESEEFRIDINHLDQQQQYNDNFYALQQQNSDQQQYQMENGQNQQVPNSIMMQQVNHVHHKRKSNFQSSHIINSKEGSQYYIVKANQEDSKEENIEKQKKSGEISSNHLTAEQDLQTSVLSPDFLQNRRKIKGNNTLTQYNQPLFQNNQQQEINQNQNILKEQESGQKIQDTYQSGCSIMRTFQLIKVPFSSNQDVYSAQNQQPFSQQEEQHQPNKITSINLVGTKTDYLKSQTNNASNPILSEGQPAPQYVQMDMPNNSQFYQMFFQILPEGILLLGSKQNKVHVQNRMLERLMNSKAGFSIDKFFSLENHMISTEASEISGTYDLMPMIMNMKTILNDSNSQQKISTQQSNLGSDPKSVQRSQFQPKAHASSDQEERTNTQGSTNRIPSLPNVSIIQSDLPPPRNNIEEAKIQQIQTQQTNSFPPNLIPPEESILQKSTLRFTPQINKTTSIKKMLSPLRRDKDPAEDQILHQISKQRSQFNFDSTSKEQMNSMSYQYNSSNTHNNIDVTYSRKKTIGEMYRSLIKEIQQDIEVNGSASKYEAFEHQLKMLCSFPSVKKKRNSNSNIKSQFNISQLVNSNNINQQSVSNVKSDTSENVESCKKIFEVTCIPCIIEGKPSVLFVVKDVTHFNQIKLLKHINKNKSQMLSQVAHEFRTPLNCIISMMEMATISNPSIQMVQYLKPALTSAKQLNSMVNDILDLAQVKAGKFSLNMESFNLQELISQIIVLMSFQSEQKGISLIENVDPQIPNQIYTDPNRLRQIIINLVSNSLKFTKKGSITIKAEQVNSKVIRISIIDTGIGIKEEDKGNLFQAFGKITGHEQRQLNPNGVGLGLMISYVLAKNLGEGEGLKVESTFGIGTEFYFEIVNNIQKMNLDKSFILKSNIVKSQYYKKSQTISPNKQDLSPMSQKQKNQNGQQPSAYTYYQNEVKQNNSNKQITPQNNKYSEDLLKTFGKISSQKEVSSTVANKIQKKEEDKEQKSLNQTDMAARCSIQLFAQPSSSSQNGNTHQSNASNQEQNNSVKIIQKEDIQEDTERSLSSPQHTNLAFSSNNKMTRNTINVIHEEDGEYEGDGSAHLSKGLKNYFKYKNSSDYVGEKSENQQQSSNTGSDTSSNSFKIKDQIGPKTKLERCFVRMSSKDYQGNPSEGNIATANHIKLNENETTPVVSDQDQTQGIQQKKIEDISELLKTNPKCQVLSNVQRYNDGRTLVDNDLDIANIEDLHDSSSDKDNSEQECEYSGQVKKPNNNHSVPTSASGNTRQKSSENKRSDSLDVQSDVNVQPKIRTQKRYKTKIKRSSSQVEFFECSHKSVSQSLSASMHQEIDILTVDDNHFNNMVLKMHIERLIKARVTCSSDGNEALQKLQEHYNKTKSGFSLIFLDLSMPEIDGYDTFRLIKHFCEEKKIIQNVVACTGYSNAEEKDKCFEIGMVDYILKPIEIPKLKEVLELFLDVNIDNK